jgi:DNA damage-binding protein 1
LTFQHSQIITEASGEIGFPGQRRSPANEAKAVLEPLGRYFAVTLYQSTVTIVIPDLDKAAAPPQQQPQRKISLRARDGRKRQTQIQHAQDHINVR